jgi:hypothetical protein
MRNMPRHQTCPKVGVSYRLQVVAPGGDHYEYAPDLRSARAEAATLTRENPEAVVIIHKPIEIFRGKARR